MADNGEAEGQADRLTEWMTLKSRAETLPRGSRL